MFGSYRKSHRRVHAGALALLAALPAGCTLTPEDGSQVQVDACPPGRTLVCTQRLGREEHCSCESEDGFEEIFEPMRR